MKLDERMAALGRALAEREAAESEGLESARLCSQSLHAVAETALESFHVACRDGGAGYLEIALSAPRTDDKHIHSVQFDLARGAHRAIVTVKSKGEVTLVGPFRIGKTEGPCNRFTIDDRSEIEAGLGELLDAFIEQAFRD